MKQSERALLRQIAQIVVKNPKRLVMGSFHEEWEMEAHNIAQAIYDCDAEEQRRLALDAFDHQDFRLMKLCKMDPKKEIKCGTAHCIAGWAQVLCLDHELYKLDPETAGKKLLPQTFKEGRFYTDNEDAMAYLKRFLPKRGAKR